MPERLVAVEKSAVLELSVTGEGEHVPMTREMLLQLLGRAWSLGATCVHLKASRRPLFRLENELLPVGTSRLRPEDTRLVAEHLLSLGTVELSLARALHTEFTMGVPGVGRFRVQLFRQRSSYGVILHCVDTQIPTLSELKIPPRAVPEVDARGLLLIGGARRDELLAAVVDARNSAGYGHIVMVERSTRYLHADKRASISQQEVGAEVESFSEGFEMAARLDPDWIVLNELPTLETAERALELAEARRCLVVFSFGAPDVEACVRQLLAVFPAASRQTVQVRLMAVLHDALALGPDGFSRLSETSAR